MLNLLNTVYKVHYPYDEIRNNRGEFRDQDNTLSIYKRFRYTKLVVLYYKFFAGVQSGNT